MRRFAIAFLLLSIILFPKNSVQSQTGIQFLNPQVEYQFGTQLIFSIQITSSSTIKQAILFIQPHGESIQTIQLSTSGNGTYSAKVQPDEAIFQPFSTIDYWFSATFEDGSAHTSDTSTFLYSDNRFSWKEMNSGSFIIHWVDGDLTFAQAVDNAAENGLASIQNLLPLTLSITPLDIYVYPHSSDLQESLGLETEKWVGGHANPELKLIFVSLPADQDQEILMEQQIPHELAHILLYQKMGSMYTNLPVWFSEGFASSAELYPDSDYSQALDRAVQNSTLIPITSLCQSFPQDTADVYLAYAESESFLHFIRQTYGSSGLNTLIGNYTNGLGCSEAVQASFHVSIETLESQWKQQSLGMDLAAVAWRKLLPYLIILVGLLLFTLLPGFLFLAKRRHI